MAALPTLAAPVGPDTKTQVEAIITAVNKAYGDARASLAPGYVLGQSEAEERNDKAIVARQNDMVKWSVRGRSAAQVAGVPPEGWKGWRDLAVVYLDFLRSMASEDFTAPVLPNLLITLKEVPKNAATDLKNGLKVAQEASQNVIAPIWAGLAPTLGAVLGGYIVLNLVLRKL